jgi:hypothetical protein
MKYLVKFIETENRIMAAMGWGDGKNWELLFNGYRISVLQNEKVLKSSAKYYQHT